MSNVLDPVYRYPLDLTSKSTTNLVTKEPHVPETIDGANEQLVIPLYGGFFSKTVTLRDENYDLLERGVDYICTYTYEDATLRTGQPVMGAVLLMTPRSKVYFAGQILGFDYAFSTTVKKDIEAWYAANPNTRPKEGAIVGKAQVFTDGEFRQQLWSFDGYEPTAAEMERISRELLLGDIEGLDALGRTVDTNNASTGQGTDSQTKKLHDHEADVNNPHGTTAAQLNLDSRLKNLSESPANVSADSDDTIALPDTLRSVIDQVFGNQLIDHRNNTNNPHHVHIHQLGGYTKEEIKNKLATRLPINTTAQSTGQISQNTETALSNDVNVYFNANNFSKGQLPLSVMGLDTPSSETVLMGNSKWRSLTSIFDEYDKPPMKIFFEGPLGPDNEAIAYVRTKYNDINAYPDGTVVIWNHASELVMWSGNDQTQSQVNLLTRCARRNGYTWEFDYNWQSSYYAATNYLYGTAGTYTFTAVKGTYSVFLVGGGGGGNGNTSAGGYGSAAAGGGSGYAAKVRASFNSGDIVKVVVGAGGYTSDGTGGTGQTTYVYVNDRLIASAGGGRGATKSGGNTTLGVGGSGASGGGSENRNAYHGKHNHYLGGPGGGGTNGGNGGADSGTGHNWSIPGGSGAGSGYYTRVMNSVDSIISHGLGSAGGGGGAWMRDGDSNWANIAGFAGGGGGVGTVNRGKWINFKGTWFNNTGTGYGAGGGGAQPGVAGVVSLVRIRHF